MVLTSPRDTGGSQNSILITVFLLGGPGGLLFLFSPATQSQDAVVQCSIQLACVFGAGLGRQGVTWQCVANGHTGQCSHM